MAELELINLYKSFSQEIVPVKDISLKVCNGEVLSLLGPSGCGKTTLLRMIAGLEEPSRGEIWIGGREVTQIRPGDRNVAMVFQSYALYPHMTVYENLTAALRLKRISKDDVIQRVQEVSEILGLEMLLQRKPRDLSGGQRQRVAVGRALVRRPDVFLLDEPLSNLDALLRERVRADLKQIFNNLKVPIVYVTHDQTEAMTLSTQIAVLNNGHLQQIDTPELVYNNPANIFVAGFVGTPQMNLLNLTCQNRYVSIGDCFICIPNNILSAYQSIPRTITIGIRPEHLSLVDTMSRDTIKGTVTLVENLGMNKLVTLQVESNTAPKNQLRALLNSKNSWDSGQVIYLSISDSYIHWFDSDSGRSLQTI